MGGPRSCYMGMVHITLTPAELSRALHNDAITRFFRAIPMTHSAEAFKLIDYISRPFLRAWANYRALTRALLWTGYGLMGFGILYGLVAPNLGLFFMLEVTGMAICAFGWSRLMKEYSTDSKVCRRFSQRVYRHIVRESVEHRILVIGTVPTNEVSWVQSVIGRD